MVANMEVDMVADMEVDIEIDINIDIDIDININIKIDININMAMWESNLVRELVTGAHLLSFASFLFVLQDQLQWRFHHEEHLF